LLAAKHDESPELVEAGERQGGLRDVKDARMTLPHQTLPDLLHDGFVAVA
jgi:hypothetical protein